MKKLKKEFTQLEENHIVWLVLEPYYYVFTKVGSNIMVRVFTEKEESLKVLQERSKNELDKY